MSLSTDGLLAGYRDFYADEPFVHVTDGSPPTKATLGSNAAHVTVRYDERTNTVRRHRRARQPGEGRVGPGAAERQPPPRPPRDHRPLDDRTDAVITSVPGFRASGLASGIKESGAPDLSIVATADGTPVTAAGVFTSNLVAAAPVQISRRHLADGRAAAVVLNSGNANAATGEQGRADALRMCELTARGRRLRDHRRARVPDRPHRHPDADGAGRVRRAEARCAAHRRRRRRSRRGRRAPHHRHRAQGHAAGRSTLPTAQTRTVGGMAKGAAMLAPSMATMLAVLTTDVAVAARRRCSARSSAAVDASFNSLVVDACQSTNDTVLVLANGAAGNEPITGTTGFAYDGFVEALAAACADLAHQMATDAEGATKCVTLTVRGARNAARSAAGGADGRVEPARAVLALRQGPVLGPDHLRARGERRDVRPRAGRPSRTTASSSAATASPRRTTTSAVAAAMEQRDLEITCDLHNGNGEATMLFTDLTHAYVDENMGTS